MPALEVLTYTSTVLYDFVRVDTGSMPSNVLQSSTVTVLYSTVTVLLFLKPESDTVQNYCKVQYCTVILFVPTVR